MDKVEQQLRQLSLGGDCTDAAQQLEPDLRERKKMDMLKGGAALHTWPQLRVA